MHTHITDQFSSTSSSYVILSAMLIVMLLINFTMLIALQSKITLRDMFVAINYFDQAWCQRYVASCNWIKCTLCTQLIISDAVNGNFMNPTTEFCYAYRRAIGDRELVAITITLHWAQRPPWWTSHVHQVSSQAKLRIGKQKLKVKLKCSQLHATLPPNQT